MSEIQFWFDNLCDLSSETELFPNPDQTLEQRMNAVTRAIILIWVLLVLIKYPQHLLFLGLSLLFIIILYYKQ